VKPVDAASGLSAGWQQTEPAFFSVCAGFAAELRMRPPVSVARVLAQSPEPRKHQVHYYGHYYGAARGKRLRDQRGERAVANAVHQA